MRLYVDDKFAFHSFIKGLEIFLCGGGGGYGRERRVKKNARTNFWRGLMPERAAAGKVCSVFYIAFFDKPEQVQGLFLLVTVLSQAFFTLVRSHLVAFSLFSAGHFKKL